MSPAADSTASTVRLRRGLSNLLPSIDGPTGPAPWAPDRRPLRHDALVRDRTGRTGLSIVFMLMRGDLLLRASRRTWLSGVASRRARWYASRRGVRRVHRGSRAPPLRGGRPPGGA